MPLWFVLLNLVIVAALGAAGWALGRTGKGAVAGLAAAVALGVFGHLTLSRPEWLVLVLPFSGAIYLSNLFPFAVALGSGCALALGEKKAQRIRIALLLILLFGVSWVNTRYFWLPAADSLGTVIDEEGICRQSDADTCSAAAIVTLLRRHSIEMTEAEAIELALTKDRRGTTRLGVYRALKIGARRGDGLSVTMRRTSAEKILARNAPTIVTVGLSGGIPPGDAEEFGRLYDWQPGVMHDVVFLGRDPGDAARVLIGEPDYGLEKWPVDHFELLFQGFAVYLEE